VWKRQAATTTKWRMAAGQIPPGGDGAEGFCRHVAPGGV